MKNTISSTRIIVKGLLSVYFLALSSILFASSDAEVITTIILINRQAELVDVSTDGEVLKRHVAVPDYFTSGRSHSNSLKRGLDLIKDYGTIDHTLPKSSSLCSQLLQSYILSETDSRLICQGATSSTHQEWRKEYVNASRNHGSRLSFSFVLVKPNIKEQKDLVKSVIKKDKIAFADVFFPSIQLVSSDSRQHNIKGKRYSRGIFVDT